MNFITLLSSKVLSTKSIKLVLTLSLGSLINLQVLGLKQALRPQIKSLATEPYLEDPCFDKLIPSSLSDALL